MSVSHSSYCPSNNRAKCQTKWNWDRIQPLHRHWLTIPRDFIIYIYIYTQHTRKENIFEFLFIKRKLNKIKLENGLEQTTKLLNENMYATQKKIKKTKFNKSKITRRLQA
jgi:hypothetical protein